MQDTPTFMCDTYIEIGDVVKIDAIECYFINEFIFCVPVFI